MYQQNIKNK